MVSGTFLHSSLQLLSVSAIYIDFEDTDSFFERAQFTEYGNLVENFYHLSLEQ